MTQWMVVIGYQAGCPTQSKFWSKVTTGFDFEYRCQVTGLPDPMTLLEGTIMDDTTTPSPTLIPEITSMSPSGYVNRYNPSLVEWVYTYQPGNGTALTSSFVPINSTEKFVIENFIIPEKGWTSVKYKGVIYRAEIISNGTVVCYKPQTEKITGTVVGWTGVRYLVRLEAPYTGIISEIMPSDLTIGACGTITPSPTLKWKCSGSPNYTCSQASDGIYNSKVDCESICKTGATDKKPGMGITKLIVLGAAVGLGILYYITQKKK